MLCAALQIENTSHLLYANFVTKDAARYVLHLIGKSRNDDEIYTCIIDDANAESCYIPLASQRKKKLPIFSVNVELIAKVDKMPIQHQNNCLNRISHNLITRRRKKLLSWVPSTNTQLRSREA